MAPAPIRILRTERMGLMLAVSELELGEVGLATQERACVVRSCIMAGTAMNAVILWLRITCSAEAASKRGSTTWAHPAINAACAEDSPPTWNKGAK